MALRVRAAHGETRKGGWAGRVHRQRAVLRRVDLVEAVLSPGLRRGRIELTEPHSDREEPRERGIDERLDLGACRRV